MLPEVIKGEFYSDERGILSFINDFDMNPVKRFYTIHHHDTKVIRAWQGHRQEQKWFHVLDGAFDVMLVKPDNWEAPANNLPVQSFSLSAVNNHVLHIPAGFATGFQATLPDSRMIVYSDRKLEESIKDDYRFPHDLWYSWNK